MKTRSSSLKILAVLLAACFPWSGFADHKSLPRVLRNGLFEIEVPNETAYADPYRDVTLSVSFTSSKGEVFSTYGFYDGGTTWRIRFRPGTPGNWQYESEFSDGSPAKSGEFRCLWRYAEHDPISVSKLNPIWFQRGVSPFQVRAFHVGDRFFAKNWPDEERNDFLHWFERQGYNTLSIASHFLNRDEDTRGRGWETPDLWPLNAEGYQHMERILDDLHQRGIAIYPFAGFFGKHGGYPTDPEEQELYVRYTTSRIGHYGNMLYNVAGPEPDMKRYIYFEVDEVVELGKLIKKYDIYDHPISVHNRTFYAPHKDSEWSSFVTLQGPKTTDRTELNEGLRELSNPGKPTFAQETLWSRNSVHMRRIGHDYSDTDMRKNSYVIKMSGASFCFADNNGNSSSGFSGSLNLDDRLQHRHDIIKQVWDFFDTVPYYEMTPRQDLVDNGFCLANPGQAYLVYLETPGTLNVAIENGPFTVEWINAQNPTQRFVTGTTSDGQNLSPPAGGEDWMLYLKKGGSGAPEQVQLSWSESPSRTATVTWMTPDVQRPAHGKIRAAGESDFRSAEGISFPSPGEGYLNRIVFRDLKPSTTYEYRVAGNVGQSPLYTFETAPEDNETYTVGFLADTGLPGRLDGNATGVLPIRDQLIAADPLFVLGGGDYAYANRDGRFATIDDAIDHWFEVYEPLLATTPFMAQYGNHEIFLDERFEQWGPRFAHPADQGVGKNYSFDVGPAHFTAFFMVNRRPSLSELAWLDADLAAARERGQQWLIVYHHEPIYAYGRAHPSKTRIAEAIIPVLEKHGVDLSLTSHDQSFERTFPLLGHPSAPIPQSTDLDEYAQGTGVIYAKVSPAGKKSETGNSFSKFFVPQQEFMARRNDTLHHYAIITVKGTQSLEVETRGVPENSDEFEVVDSFRIVAE